MPEKDEQIRALKFKLHELTQSLEIIRDEAKTLRQERDNAAYSLEEYRSKCEETIARFKTRIGSAEAERGAFEQKLAINLLDAERRESLTRTLKQSAEDLSGELEHARKQAHEAESRLTEAIDEHTKLVIDLRNQYEGEKRELIAQIDGLSDRLSEREEMVKRCQRESAEMQMRSESSDGEARRSYQAQIQEIMKKCSSLEVELMDERNSNRSSHVQHVKYQEKAEVEIEYLQSEIARLKREKDALHDRVREVEARVDVEKRKGLHTRKDASAKAVALHDAMTKARKRIEELESALAASVRLEATLRAEARTTQSKLDKDVHDHEGLVKAMQEELRSRMERLEREYRERLEGLKAKCKQAVTKEKKRAEAYKERAMEAHRREKALSEATLMAATGGLIDLDAARAGGFNL